MQMPQQLWIWGQVKMPGSITVARCCRWLSFKITHHSSLFVEHLETKINPKDLRYWCFWYLVCSVGGRSSRDSLGTLNCCLSSWVTPSTRNASHHFCHSSMRSIRASFTAFIISWSWPQVTRERTCFTGRRRGMAPSSNVFGKLVVTPTNSVLCSEGASKISIAPWRPATASHKKVDPQHVASDLNFFLTQLKLFESDWDTFHNKEWKIESWKPLPSIESRKSAKFKVPLVCGYFAHSYWEMHDVVFHCVYK